MTVALLKYVLPAAWSTMYIVVRCGVQHVAPAEVRRLTIRLQDRLRTKVYICNNVGKDSARNTQPRLADNYSIVLPLKFQQVDTKPAILNRLDSQGPPRTTHLFPGKCQTNIKSIKLKHSGFHFFLELCSLVQYVLELFKVNANLTCNGTKQNFRSPVHSTFRKL